MNYLSNAPSGSAVSRNLEVWLLGSYDGKGVAVIVEAHLAEEVRQIFVLALEVAGSPFLRDTDGQAAKEAQEESGLTMTDSTAILIGGHIQRLMQPVLNAPFLALRGEPGGRRQTRGFAAGQEPDRFRLASLDLAPQDGGLSRAGKANLAGADDGTDQGADFDPPAVTLAALRPLRGRLLWRGKRLPGCPATAAARFGAASVGWP